MLGHVDSGGLSGVARVLLEGKAQEAEVLVRHSVEESLDDARGEALLLVIVHLDNSNPGDLRNCDTRDRRYRY